jgi:glycine cleavage system H protein
MSQDQTVAYRRARFGTRLPANRRYTAAHYWLLEQESGLWRIGFTKFATRMLGELVDFGFTPAAGDAVELGQAIGWVEGFKAVTDIYAVAAGQFLGINPEADRDISLIDSDPYGRGWLYQVRGTPDPASLDIHGYVAVLDATIDKMLASRHDVVEGE